MGLAIAEKTLVAHAGRTGVAPGEFVVVCYLANPAARAVRGAIATPEAVVGGGIAL